MAFINSSVYSEGITPKLINNSTDDLFLVLTSSELSSATITSTDILAVSGNIKNNSLNYTKDGSDVTKDDIFSLNGKTLTLAEIPYYVTIDNVDSSSTARGFAIISATANTNATTTYTEGSTTYTIFGPNTDSTKTVLIAGALSNSPTINDSSNFKFSSTTITFSETSAT